MASKKTPKIIQRLKAELKQLDLQIKKVQRTIEDVGSWELGIGRPIRKRKKHY